MHKKRQYLNTVKKEFLKRNSFLLYYYAFFKFEVVRRLGVLLGLRRIIGSSPFLTASSVIITFSIV